MIRIGTVVRLKKGRRTRRGKQTARVLQRFSDIPGGVVLDGYLADFRCWNVSDLERADAPTEGRTI